MFKKIFSSVLFTVILGGLFFMGLNEYYSKEKSIQVQGVARKYRVHLPKTYDSSKKYPIIIGFHDSTGSPRFFELNTGLSTLANQKNFIMVYPYGSSSKRFSTRTWNADFCCGYAKDQKINEVLFVSTLIDELAKDYSVDTAKIFLLGYSNGAMLVNKLGIELADRLAGVAIVSGAVWSTNTETEESIYLTPRQSGVPAILFHGKNDASVPFDGGGVAPEFNFAPVYDSVNYWLDSNKCSVHPNQIVKKAGYTLEEYSTCETGSKVFFYTLEQGKHSWPGGILQVRKYFDKEHIVASKVILEFFGL